MSKGSLYELQPDGTYSKFEVEYNHQKDSENYVLPSNQVPLKKNLISKGHTNMALSKPE
jgi:hypothetical protein